MLLYNKTQDTVYNNSTNDTIKNIETNSNATENCNPWVVQARDLR